MIKAQNSIMDNMSPPIQNNIINQQLHHIFEQKRNSMQCEETTGDKIENTTTTNSIKQNQVDVDLIQLYNDWLPEAKAALIACLNK